MLSKQLNKCERNNIKPDSHNTTCDEERKNSLLIIADVKSKILELITSLSNHNNVIFVKDIDSLSQVLDNALMPDAILCHIDVFRRQLIDLLRISQATANIPIILVANDAFEISDNYADIDDYCITPHDISMIDFRINKSIQSKKQQKLIDEQMEYKNEMIKFSQDRNELIKNLRSDRRNLLKVNQSFKSDVQKISKERDLYKSILEVDAALSKEKNPDKLLKMILEAAIDFTNADGGTIYLAENNHLNIKVMINRSDKQNQHPKQIENLPLVPLFTSAGLFNSSNVSACAFHSKKTINIGDVYDAVGFDFKGPQQYDVDHNYHTKSMLAVPLHDGQEAIGVLLLINAQDPKTKEIINFAPNCIEAVDSFASKMAITLRNAQLSKDIAQTYQDQIQLFHSFIKSIATAIDQKSPYTAGHITRVVDLSMIIAQAINDSKDGSFQNIEFSEDQLEELRISAWLHDVGKITTPDHIIDKKTKLDDLFDRVNIIKLRFCMLGQRIINDYAEMKIALLRVDKLDLDNERKLDLECYELLTYLEDSLKIIIDANNSSEYMPDVHFNALQDIAKKTLLIGEQKFKLLSAKEFESLSVRKGNLNSQQREIIENHVVVTKKILEQLPFPPNLANVAKYACEHHEKFNGTGYPNGLNYADLSIQSQILLLADIFEALTARDRPYKKPMNLSQALQIINKMGNDKLIDPNLVEFFHINAIYLVYGLMHMSPEQFDIDLKNIPLSKQIVN